MSSPPTSAASAGAQRVLLVTDAWLPQVNGVVRTVQMLGRDLEAMGHAVAYATPEGRLTLPMPTYPEIRLSIFPRRSLERMIDEFRPDAIHIATEGPLGLAARRICISRKFPFTTSFHTRFPEYVHARFPLVSENAVYRFLRWFHGPAESMMVATRSLKSEMEAHGFHNLKIWSRGVDVDAFRPIPDAHLPYEKPIFLCVGRVAVEKNIEAFLALDLPGTKVIVGDGPQRTELERGYPNAVFVGTKSGDELVRYYAASDVFVFPSRTDTFGLVLLESLSCGTPVAAYPVTGPKDVIGDAPVGVLDNDLKAACLKALQIPRGACRQFAVAHSWRACTEEFLSNLPEIAPKTA